MQGSVQRERPMGVTILAVLAIIGGLLALLGALGLLLGGAALASVDGGVGGMAMLLGVGALVLAVLYLAFGFGAWTLKPWAWTLGVASQVLQLVLIIVNIVVFGFQAGQIINILIAAVILYYLFTPPIRQAFGKA